MAALLRALPVMSAEPPCICPLTLEPPEEPVTTPCGHTFERAALDMHRTVAHAGRTLCPLCRQPLGNQDVECFGLSINTTMRDMIEGWEQMRQQAEAAAAAAAAAATATTAGNPATSRATAPRRARVAAAAAAATATTVDSLVTSRATAPPPARTAIKNSTATKNSTAKENKSKRADPSLLCARSEAFKIFAELALPARATHIMHNPRLGGTRCRTVPVFRGVSGGSCLATCGV
mmetsp:Transcript_29575/g.69200  ORF Transcript_29575/g.69200 Transcript_29575/m.69200 type:complete len:234 (-) Transcript_29575:43-744(-)